MEPTIAGGLLVKRRRVSANRRRFGTQIRNARQRRLPTPTSRDRLKATPRAALVRVTGTMGVDVSHYQGTVNWGKVSKAGITFAIAKATEGETVVDSQFATNWKGIKQAGLVRGAYHFFRPESDALTQAKSFVTTVGKLDKGDLPPALDVEEADGAKAAAILDGIGIWVAHVESAMKVKPLIYTRASFWKSSCNDSDRFADHPLWICHYTGATEPTLPSAWEHWTLWQYSDKGSVKGIAGPVDFNRSHDTLRQLVQRVIRSTASRRARRQRNRRET